MTTVGFNRFTTFTQHAGDKIVYVDNSVGASGNGLTPATAVKTIAEGAALLTNNSSDYLLLRQGGAWFERLAPSMNLNGRSTSEPIVFGAYNPSVPVIVNDGSGGLPRPFLSVAAAQLGFSNNTGFGNYIAIVGLEFSCYDRDPNNGAFNATARDAVSTCLSIGNGTKWLLVEDCKFSFFALAINMTPFNLAVRNEVIIFNRNIIVDSYGGVTVQCGGHNRLLFWQNLWDKNGYNNQIGGNYLQGYGPANFSHGLYMSDNFNNPSVGWYITGPVDLIDNIYARDVTGFHARAGGHFDNNLIVGNCGTGDFGRPMLGTNNYIINNIIAENIDQPYQPLAITGITPTSPAVFTYTPSIAFPTDPDPNSPGSQWWIFRLAGSLTSPLTALGLYDIQNINTTAKTFTAKDHNTGAAINLGSAGGACTLYDVGTSIDGACINLYHINPNIPDVLSSTGPVLVQSNIFVNYAGTVAYNGYCVAVEAGQISANVTIKNNIAYKWAATPGRITLFKDDDGKATIVGNIQDTNGDGTDDNTSAAITQYTTTSANSATMANYAASVGLTASLDAFLTACRARLPGTWDVRLAGGTVCDWYRAKFNQPRYFPAVPGLRGGF